MTESKRVALVTGAGSGVGRHSSLALLEAGYHLVLVGRREDALEETKTLAGVNASKCLIVSCDVSDPKSIKSLFTVTKEQFGRLDLLFNNAGIGALPSLLRTYCRAMEIGGRYQSHRGFSLHPGSFQDYERTEPQGGRIINNGSISAHVPRPFSSPYTATKHAITGLTVLHHWTAEHTILPAVKSIW